MSSKFEFPLRLPRHAFSARGAARAGDLWRCFQEAALEGSTRAGWPPSRYRAGGNAFVVGEMTVRHYDEARYGEPVHAKTWISRFQRGTIAVREVRLFEGGSSIASASQKWVHVGSDMRPRRAPADLIEAFAEYHDTSTVELPSFTPFESEGSPFSFSFRPWHTAMDPLDHVNHPAYVDWCDEVVCRFLHSHRVWPAELVPVAERIAFKAAAAADVEVTVETRPAGLTNDRAVVFRNRIVDSEGQLLARGTTVRRLASRPEQLAELIDRSINSQ